MKFAVFSLLALINSQVLACSNNELLYEKAEKMGVWVEPWIDFKQDDIIQFKKQYSCTSFEISAPETIPNNPDLTRLEVAFEIIKDDKIYLTGNLDTLSIIGDKTNTGYGCLPLESGQVINIILSYHAQSGITFCAPSFRINDFDKFIKSAYNKPIKRD